MSEHFDLRSEVLLFGEGKACDLHNELDHAAYARLSS